jgi:hypothetical protein
MMRNPATALLAISGSRFDDVFVYAPPKTWQNLETGSWQWREYEYFCGNCG